MKKSLSQQVLSILQKKGTRLKFREIKEITKAPSNRALEQAISEVRAQRKDLVYAKFDKTYYLDETPTHYSDVTDLSQNMPLTGSFGLISDTHLGSNAERLDLIKEAYQTFKDRGVHKVFHTGDLTDGYKQYRGHHAHVKVYGDAPQALRVIKSYPKVEGITTYIIGGN